MSKQFLLAHTIDDASPGRDIFSVAVSSSQVIVGSGGPSIKIYDHRQPDYPLVQTLENSHPHGCHHIAVDSEGSRAASVGFNDPIRVWKSGDEGQWLEDGELRVKDGRKMIELWAICISKSGDLLACTTAGGKLFIWSLKHAERQNLCEFDTKGQFGSSIALSSDGKLLASGHQNGGVYLFSLNTRKLLHSLTGLMKCIRAVAFSPGGTLLATAGDSTLISLYDVGSGEHVFDLEGHKTWVFGLDWNDLGDHLTSCSFDGMIKIWSLVRRECVSTSSSVDKKAVWSVKWMPKLTRSGRVCAGGAGGALECYREAAGG